MLFDSYLLRNTQLKNRAVMAPLTRSRAVDNNTPNSLMAEYYSQRATAGLIVTEGTSPSPNGLGYARIPGLFNEAHVAGWQLVTDAVHEQGGKIVVQLMHTGRIGQQANLPVGAEVIGPSSSIAPGEIWTDAHGNLPYSSPREMSILDIETAVREFAESARLAIAAGFDGIELHAANGYLIEQFLNANVNQRSDNYGGSPERRNRFAIAIARATADAIGADHVGIRLSPHGDFNATGGFDGVDEQYVALVKELSSLELMYVHVLDHSAMGAPPVPPRLKADLRAAFDGPFILAGGFVEASAEQALQEHRADLIAMGLAFLANPDLVYRMRTNSPLNAPDPTTFYTPGAQGYTDYPALLAHGA